MRFPCRGDLLSSPRREKVVRTSFQDDKPLWVNCSIIPNKKAKGMSHDMPLATV